MKKTKEKGITLIALIITIIVLLILAGVSLNMIMGDNGILKQAKTATVKQRFAKYKEELELGMYGKITVAGEPLKNYIQSMTSEDIDNFVVINGELAYIGNNEEEKTISDSLGVNSSMSGNNESAVKDIQNIINKVIPIKDSVEVPNDDTEIASAELVGTRLYDKNSLNGDRWKIVIDYNDFNQETGRYGSGYYLLKSGENYTINGESLSFSKDFIIDYKNGTMIGLTDKAIEWSLNSTLAVNDGLVLNIDPTNLADGNWTGITKHGDVIYDNSSKALLFNEDTTNNPNGEGGYLELKRNDVDFSNGFTFEIYANLSRLKYDNNLGYTETKNMGYFCRTIAIGTDDEVALSMRFGNTDAKTICKFNTYSTWYGDGKNLNTISAGDVKVNDECGYNENEDFYLTFVYRTYNEQKEDENYDNYMKENKVDKVEYYINGNLFGYTYYGSDSYRNGLDTWNNSKCPFFIGVSPWYNNENLYYLKGKVYTTRLYTTSMTPEEVKSNMDMTQKYRASF